MSISLNATKPIAQRAPAFNSAAHALAWLRSEKAVASCEEEIVYMRTSVIYSTIDWCRYLEAEVVLRAAAYTIRLV